MKRQTIVNWCLTVLLLAILVVCFIFQKCTLDIIVILVAAVLMVAGISLLSFQIKRLKEKEEDEAEE